MVGTIEEIIKYLFNQDKTKKYEVKEYKEKRSNNANAYFHLLVNQLARHFNISDEDFISLNSSNHLGVPIGEVIGINKDKIKIKLSHSINQGDAVRLPNNKGMYVNFLYNSKMMLINSATSKEVIYLDNKVDLIDMGSVSLTINSKLISELNKTLEKKINLKCIIKAKLGDNLYVSYSDGKNQVEYIGTIVDEAKSSPISKERIKDILAKLGNTPFKLMDIDCDIDNNIFIPVGVLNEVRRKLVDELIKKRTSVNRNIKLQINDFTKIQKASNDYYISALARSEEQVNILLELNVDFIYVTSEELYNKYRDKGVILRLDRVKNSFADYKGYELLIGETGSLKYIKNNLVSTDYYLNVVNSSYVNYLTSLGVKKITLSPELSIDRIKLIATNSNANLFEFIVYGRIEYMIMKYNMAKVMKFKQNKKYELSDIRQRRFPIISDKYTHLMSNNPIDLTDKIEELKIAGVNVFRLELFDEKANLIKKIVEEIRKSL